MKFYLDKELFTQAIKNALKIIPSKLVKPILGNVLIDFKDDKITEVTSTNLETFVTSVIPYDGEKPNKPVLLQVSNIAKILPFYKNEKFEFEINENNDIVLLDKKSQYVFKQAFNHDEFPIFQDKNSEQAIPINSEILEKAIRFVRVSAAAEATRYTLNSIFIELKGKNLNMVTSDGKRMSKISIQLQEKQKERDCLLPITSIDLILSAMKGAASENTLVSLCDKMTFFETGNTRIVARNLAGSFPNKAIEEIMLKLNKYDNFMVLNKEELIEKIKIANLFDSNTDAKSVTLDQKENQLCIISKDTSNDSNSQSLIDIIKIKQDTPLKIKFNPVYILQLLQSISEDDVEVELKTKTPDDALYVKSSLGESVVMPQNPDK